MAAYLHAILELGHYRALRDEGEELAAPCEWQRDDESAEDEHLCHQEEEDLAKDKVSTWVILQLARGRCDGHGTIVLWFSAIGAYANSNCFSLRAVEECCNLQGCSRESYWQRSFILTRGEDVCCVGGGAREVAARKKVGRCLKTSLKEIKAYLWVVVLWVEGRGRNHAGLSAVCAWACERDVCRSDGRGHGPRSHSGSWSRPLVARPYSLLSNYLSQHRDTTIELELGARIAAISYSY